MNRILNDKIKLCVYRYRNKKEMNAHIHKMCNKGWECRYNGKTNFSTEISLRAYKDKKNWAYCAEFYMENKIKTCEVMSYQCQPIFIGIYNIEK